MSDRANGGTKWSLEAYAAHNEALRVAEEKFQGERDRRYAEVRSADERALRVKEQGDRDALQLAREIQTYKDLKANELREQISSERGNYASKGDLLAATEKLQATIVPMAAYIAAQQGGSKGMRDTWSGIVIAIMAGAAVGGFIVRVL